MKADPLMGPKDTCESRRPSAARRGLSAFAASAGKVRGLNSLDGHERDACQAIIKVAPRHARSGADLNTPLRHDSSPSSCRPHPGIAGNVLLRGQIRAVVILPARASIAALHHNEQVPHVGSRKRGDLEVALLFLSNMPRLSATRRADLEHLHRTQLG